MNFNPSLTVQLNQSSTVEIPTKDTSFILCDALGKTHTLVSYSIENTSTWVNAIKVRFFHRDYLFHRNKSYFWLQELVNFPSKQEPELKREFQSNSGLEKLSETDETHLLQLWQGYSFLFEKT